MLSLSRKTFINFIPKELRTLQYILLACTVGVILNHKHIFVDEWPAFFATGLSLIYIVFIALCKHNEEYNPHVYLLSISSVNLLILLVFMIKISVVQLHHHLNLLPFFIVLSMLCISSAYLIKFYIKDIQNITKPQIYILFIAQCIAWCAMIELPNGVSYLNTINNSPILSTMYSAICFWIIIILIRAKHTTPYTNNKKHLIVAIMLLLSLYLSFRSESLFMPDDFHWSYFVGPIIT